MKHIILLLLVFTFSATGFSQDSATEIVQVNKENDTEWKQWMDNLYEIGIIIQDDSMIISDEAKRIASDSEMRKIIFPETYQWPEAQYLLKKMYVKTGLWYLINLYPQSEENKKAVLQYVISLDGSIDVEKALLGSFYTYIFFDPQASTMKNGKPDITRPDILENKLAVLREIANYVHAERLKKK